MRNVLMASLLTGSLACSASAQTPRVNVPANNVLDGAIAGAVVSGRPGAIWADQDHDGRVDGYTYNGQYHVGAPATISVPVSPVNQPSNRTGERG